MGLSDLKFLKIIILGRFGLKVGLEVVSKPYGLFVLSSLHAISAPSIVIPYRLNIVLSSR